MYTETFRRCMTCFGLRRKITNLNKSKFYRRQCSISILYQFEVQRKKCETVLSGLVVNHDVALPLLGCERPRRMCGVSHWTSHPTPCWESDPIDIIPVIWNCSYTASTVHITLQFSSMFTVRHMILSKEYMCLTIIISLFFQENISMRKWLGFWLERAGNMETI